LIVILLIEVVGCKPHRLGLAKEEVSQQVSGLLGGSLFLKVTTNKVIV